jgi:two-component system, OmpR family, sensor histidine kinase ChvG
LVTGINMKRRKKYTSRITLRILAVNIGALIILAFGLLYTGQYEREMVNAELNSLATEGRLLAAALGGGGVRETLGGEPVLTEDLSRHMLRKLVETDTFRIILFNKTGKLLLDSHQLQGHGGAIQMVELEPPFSTWSLTQKISYGLQRALALLPTRLHFAPYPTKRGGVETYPGMVGALAGETSVRAWHDAEGHILLTAALPVQNLKNVLGGVLVMRSGKNIEEAVHGIQLTVLKLFLWALLVTLWLSIYLSETIGIPLLRLAVAAEQVERSLLLKGSIPDFSGRNDEIGVLSAALRNMTEALAERIDAIGNFAADVAHEIKNPLASLKSAVETLMVVQDPERQKKLLAIIEDDVNRLNRLITDISSASRLDSEMTRAPKEPVNMTAFLRDVASFEETHLNLQGRFTLQIEEGLWINGNGTQLGQVMDNLIQNAASFLSPAGKITIAALRQEDKVIIHVDNDGPPIPEKKLEAIFERFYSERPESEKFGLHSGLGLSISRQIIRAHKGAVFARNISNVKGQHQGVRFTIVLPAERAPK